MANAANRMRTAVLAALAAETAFAGEVKSGQVVCAKHEQGAVIDFACWASDGAKSGEGGVYVFLEKNIKEAKVFLARLMDEGKIPHGIAISFGAGRLPPACGDFVRGLRAGELDQPGTEYPSVIVEEIVPAAEKLLGLKAGASPDLHFICGASSGGIAAWNACWFRNDWFRRCYCNSPTFSNMRGGNQLMPLARKCETRPIRACLTCGTDEPDYFFGDSYLVAEDAVSALRFAGYEVRFDRFVHGGHGAAWWGDDAHFADVLAWLFEDWRTKPVSVATNPLRVRDVLAKGSLWRPCGFKMPPPRREARSSDLARVYSVAPDCRFVMSERVQADGARDQRLRLSALELAWNATRVGGTALAVAADDRVWVATELGVQGVVSFGLTDVVLPLPCDLPCDNVALVGTTLYASSGEKVFCRELRVGAVDPENPTKPATPGYADGFWYSRDHEPAGGVGELIGSYVVAGRIAGAASVLVDADGRETFDCAGWAVYGARGGGKLTPDSVFALGSTERLFRRLAEACAHDDGKASLDAVGEPYADYLKRKVLDPLGLKDTTFAPSEEQRARLVTAYNADDAKIRKADGPAAEGLFSSPRDLVRFARLLACRGVWKGKPLVSRAAFEAAFQSDGWLCGGRYGGAPQADVCADLATGRCRVFLLQTDTPEGSAFVQLKREWHDACDFIQKSGPSRTER